MRNNIWRLCGAYKQIEYEQNINKLTKDLKAIKWTSQRETFSKEIRHETDFSTVMFNKEYWTTMDDVLPRLENESFGEMVSQYDFEYISSNAGE